MPRDFETAKAKHRRQRQMPRFAGTERQEQPQRRLSGTLRLRGPFGMGPWQGEPR